MNVLLPSGKSQHVTFMSLSNGSSELVTKNVILQQALESHRWFNTLFRLVKSVDESKMQTSAAPAAAEKLKPLKKIRVTDLASAKDYLADTFEISRTALKNRKNIVEQAAAFGIEFEEI